MRCKCWLLDFDNWDSIHKTSSVWKMAWSFFYFNFMCLSKMTCCFIMRVITATTGTTWCRESGSGAYRGQLRPKLVHSEAAPPACQSRSHTAVILHGLTETSFVSPLLCSPRNSQKDGLAASPSVSVFRFHQTDKWSGQSEDCLWNDKHVNNRLGEGGGGCVWILYSWHQCCGYCFPTFIMKPHQTGIKRQADF